MTETVVGVYNSLDQVRGAKDELVATGIPREKICVEEESRRIEVICPDACEPEIREILDRHEPFAVEKHHLDDKS